MYDDARLDPHAVRVRVGGREGMTSGGVHEKSTDLLSHSWSHSADTHRHKLQRNSLNFF